MDVRPQSATDKRYIRSGIPVWNKVQYVRPAAKHTFLIIILTAKHILICFSDKVQVSHLQKKVAKLSIWCSRHVFARLSINQLLNFSINWWTFVSV